MDWKRSDPTIKRIKTDLATRVGRRTKKKTPRILTYLFLLLLGIEKLKRFKRNSYHTYYVFCWPDARPKVWDHERNGLRYMYTNTHARSVTQHHRRGRPRRAIASTVGLSTTPNGTDFAASNRSTTTAPRAALPAPSGPIIFNLGIQNWMRLKKNYNPKFNGCITLHPILPPSKKKMANLRGCDPWFCPDSLYYTRRGHIPLRFAFFFLEEGVRGSCSFPRSTFDHPFYLKFSYDLYFYCY